MRESFHQFAHLKGRVNLEKLSCRRRVALLCDYLDGELSASARRAVAAHRRSCLPCAQVLKSLERTVAALRGLKMNARAPSGARRSLRAALRGVNPK
ncbi:MAG: zf-HC2 domain-containing protein [Elusimicrobiota bacterium]